jgi:hypothetical protein
MPKKITELYAFVVTCADGDEGIMAFKSGDITWMPMIGADLDRIESLRRIADAIAKETGTQYEVRYFTRRTEP